MNRLCKVIKVIINSPDTNAFLKEKLRLVSDKNNLNQDTRKGNKENASIIVVCFCSHNLLLSVVKQKWNNFEGSVHQQAAIILDISRCVRVGYGNWVYTKMWTMHFLHVLKKIFHHSVKPLL